MAGSVNKVILIGRLGQDPKLTYLPSGSPVVEMSVATDESYKDREGNKVEKTEWHRVKAFGRTAEFCSNYLSKGRLVYVEGSLRTRSWEDQQGQKRYMTEVVVSGPGHSVQFMDSRSQSADAPGGEYGGGRGDYGGSGGRGNYGSQGGGQGGVRGGQSGQAGGQGAPSGPGARGGERQPSGPPQEEDYGPAFPSESSGMDDVPF